ncbi:LuxR C-terminal-related transcriptional regulator [Subtercola boreus]|uniref:response regulator transcription factor n=1 Tax=Subtercola boreus TaxID=120213 RepID=UPI000E2E6760
MLMRPFVLSDTEPVVALWEECGLVRSWNDPRKDIARKLTVQPELFLVGVAGGPGGAGAGGAGGAGAGGPGGAAYISEATTKTHVRNILNKLWLQSRAQIVVYAYENGLLTP